MLYKGIVHEVLNDAPFIGAIIVAPFCNLNCPDCQNQHLKDKPLLSDSINDILNKVQDNPINEGVILAGLEWTDDKSIYSAIRLIDEALKRNMKVMLYTGSDEAYIAKFYPQLLSKPIWVKFGSYDPTCLSVYESYGVKLASTNQYIKWFGKEGVNGACTI